MVELKDCQQQEAEGKLQFHSHLTLIEWMFASLQVHNLEDSYLGNLSYRNLKTPRSLPGFATPKIHSAPEVPAKGSMDICVICGAQLILSKTAQMHTHTDPHLYMCKLTILSVF